MVSWGTVQRAIENYRRWIIAGLQFFDELNVYPDLDNLLSGNPENISGLSNGQHPLSSLTGLELVPTSSLAMT